MWHHLLNLRVTNKYRGSPKNNASNFPEIYESPLHKKAKGHCFLIRFNLYHIIKSTQENTCKKINKANKFLLIKLKTPRF